MNPLELLEQAEEFARYVHSAQVRRNGEPYIKHPERVARIVDQLGGDSEAEALAWVHDTLEDGGPKALEALEVRFDPNFVSQVKALTRRELEPYDDFVTRVIGFGWRVRLVKIADIIDNLTDAPTERKRKEYFKALARFKT